MTTETGGTTRAAEGSNRTGKLEVRGQHTHTHAQVFIHTNKDIYKQYSDTIYPVHEYNSDTV